MLVVLSCIGTEGYSMRKFFNLFHVHTVGHTHVHAQILQKLLYFDT